MTTANLTSLVARVLHVSGAQIREDEGVVKFDNEVGETRVDIAEESGSPNGAQGFSARIITPLSPHKGMESIVFLGSLNHMAVMSAVVLDEDAGGLSLSTTLRWDLGVSETSMATLLSACAMLQSPTFQQGVKLLLRFPYEALDLSGRDEQPDGLSDDFSKTEALLKEALVMAFADSEGLTAELPWDKGALSAAAGHKTSLLQFDGSLTHPIVGRGLAYRLKMHPVFDTRTARALANTLNDLEMKQRLPPCPGAWGCAAGEEQLVFSGFIPTFAYWPGLAMLLVDWLRLKHNSAAWFVRELLGA